jgi:glycosyltransferase involved in cell wall biosynthesis
MKVLHIITGLRLGGAEGILLRLVSNDKKNKHYVISLTSKSYYSEKFIDIGIDVYYFNFYDKSRLIKNIWDLVIVIRDISPTIIQTWMYHANFLSILLKPFFINLPFFWNLRATYSFTFSSISLNIIQVFLSLFSFIVPKKIICCSETVKINHIRYFNNSKLVVVNNGFDVLPLNSSELKRVAFRNSLNLGKESVIFGMACRYHLQKDFKTLFESLSLIKKRGFIDFKIVLVGVDLNYDNFELVNMIKSYNLVGFVLLNGVSNDINEFFGVIDFYFMTSSYGEGFPNVIAEAMLCGIPCISTNIGEAAKIINTFGFVVEPQRPDLFADEIIRFIKIMEDKSSFGKLKNQCREFIESNYSTEKMILNYNNIWIIH